MDFSISGLNYNSVETIPGFESRAAFTVNSQSVLNEDATKIVRLLRKEACYCRFTPADSRGRISKLLYANWRKSIS